jgi:hypothetical protein
MHAIHPGLRVLALPALIGVAACKHHVAPSVCNGDQIIADAAIKNGIEFIIYAIAIGAKKRWAGKSDTRIFQTPLLCWLLPYRMGW